MQAKVTRIIAAFAVSALIAAGAATADENNAAVDKAAATASDAAESNRDRARLAHNAAVEDAIEAVLQANKLHLDIRLTGRTSVQMADSR